MLSSHSSQSLSPSPRSSPLSASAFSVLSRFRSAGLQTRIFVRSPVLAAPLSTNSFTIRTYEKSSPNPSRICTSKKQDLKPFRICIYKKTGEGVVPLSFTGSYDGSRSPSEYLLPTTHHPLLTIHCLPETMPLRNRQTTQRASVPGRCLNGRNS